MFPKRLDFPTCSTFDLDAFVLGLVVFAYSLAFLASHSTVPGAARAYEQR